MTRFVLLLALGWFLSAAPVRAGVYGGPPTPALLPNNFNIYLDQLRAMAAPGPKEAKPGSVLEPWVRQLDALEEKQKAGKLGTIDAVQLSACYIRLGRLREAIALLEGADQKHFLVRANLATALFLNGQVELALRHQRLVLQMWPDTWWGWTRAKNARMRRFERYFLRLLESRAAEAMGRAPERLKLDPLFAGVQFVGPAGRYTAGEISATMEDRLPPDAFDVALRMVIWLPADDRLYWLLAEVLNAGNFVPQAHAILEQLGDRVGGKFDGLLEHRAILKRALPLYKKMQPAEETANLLMHGLVIPGPMIPGGPAALVAYYYSTGASRAWAPHVGKPPRQTELTPTEERPEVKPAPLNWKHIAVGFGSGFLVAALAALQVLEVRRRRAAREPEAEPQSQQAETQTTSTGQAP